MGTDEKTIVIGCDQPDILLLMLERLKSIPNFFINVISTSRVSDLLSITKSMYPGLLILNFRNNQGAINDFNQFVNKPEIPILCIAQKFESQSYLLDLKNIVFSYSIENIINTGQFICVIRSIFLLKDQSKTTYSSYSIASQSMERDQFKSDRNMSRYVLELDQKVEVLLNVRERIKTLFPQVDDTTRIELLSIINAIKASANDTKLWDDFKLYFEKTNPNFLLLLSEKHPQLSTKDLKYCCYLKMNMSNDDIRNLLGINQESVSTHKYRLKKKMRLGKNLDLHSYVKSF
jgi:DNA-binding CsgD family transcriptional regulator